MYKEVTVKILKVLKTFLQDSNLFIPEISLITFFCKRITLYSHYLVPKIESHIEVEPENEQSK